jgi:hypothetical protein
MTLHRLALLVAFVTPTVLSAQDVALTSFIGFVVDSAQHPIANADVAIGGLDLKAKTDDKGAFTMKDVPAGIHRVTVRHIGYAVLDTLIVFPANQIVQRRVTLGATAVTLDSIVSEAPRRDPVMAEFEENRARGFGRFLGTDELAKMTVRPLGLAVQQMQGIAVIRGGAGQGWVTGKHAPSTHCPSSVMGAKSPQAARAAQDATDECLRRERVYYVPDPSEEMQGVKRACYAVVYVDRHIMNPGIPTPPYDLNVFTAEQLIGVEWYTDDNEAPPQYASRQAQCGIAVLHLKKRG